MEVCKMRRAVPATPSELLPLQLETIGIQYDQEPMTRPHGYPCYHWLQTLAGEGELSMNGRTWNMPERSGILLAPGTPTTTSQEATVGKPVTSRFTGARLGTLSNHLAGASLNTFSGAGHDPITHQMKSLLAFAESGGDPSGWRYSADLYRFLTLLRTEARTDKRPPISKQLDRVQDLLHWLEQEYANPEIGLAEMAAQLGIGKRQLNERFRDLFGQTAYAYLIQLRLRKAKNGFLPVLTGPYAGSEKRSAFAMRATSSPRSGRKKG